MTNAHRARPTINHLVRTVRLTMLIGLCAQGNMAMLGQTAQKGPSVPPTDSGAGYISDGVAANLGRKADVKYDGSSITVAASNSSLAQILHEIARQTGMKITGGIAEDRVFGNYGPASPSAVLSTLLDGTGSNMLIVQDAEHRPTELILTPRVGGVTPPNPNASSENNEGSANAVQAPVRFPPPPPAPTQFNSRSPYRRGTGGMDANPAATAPSTTSQQVAFPPIDGTTPPATATTTPMTPDQTSPDAVRTPQQIFEQLQRLRQQQTQPPKQ